MSESLANINVDRCYFGDDHEPELEITKRNTEMRYIGLDVGTSNLCAGISTDGKPKKELSRVRDAFFKMDLSTYMNGMQADFAENILKQQNAHYVKIDEVLYVLGDDALKFANLFHQECLRPMANGVLNPAEPISSIMLRELIRGLIGNCDNPEDIVYFCTPANPIDATFNNIFHTDMIKSILSNLGYKNINVMNEALAIAYSELQNEGMSGLLMSCGAGMINLAYTYMGIPIFTFSMTKSGDWIDENVANAISETKAIVQATKEDGISILEPKNTLESAVAIYYNALLENIVKQFKNAYSTKSKKELPNITAPLTAVVAGGTSMVGGFIERISPMLMDKGFPVPIGKVVHAKDPLMSIASGLCNAALMANKKK